MSRWVLHRMSRCTHCIELEKELQKSTDAMVRANETLARAEPYLRDMKKTLVLLRRLYEEGLVPGHMNKDLQDIRDLIYGKGI